MIHGEVGEEKYDYDLIVIGGGSGGLAASKVMALASGLMTCLFEWTTSE
jgi:ribulose 1,5-bisphosphate synthetase/thiazole synthase